VTTIVDLSPSGEQRIEPEWLIINLESRSERRHPWLRRGMLAGILALTVIMIISARVTGLGREADGFISWNRLSKSSPVITDDAEQDQKQPAGYRRSSVVQMGHPLLETKSSWELYAETADEVIKIQPVDDRVRCPAPLPWGGDRRSGDRHNVDLALSNVSPWLAAASPDGHYLAVVYAVAHHPLALHVLDLQHGHDRVTTVAVDQTLREGSLAWSPDSDFLLVAGVKGRLWVINPDSAVVSAFPVRLPAVRQLAVRPAIR
jgi:hypothetical protein